MEVATRMLGRSRSVLQVYLMRDCNCNHKCRNFLPNCFLCHGSARLTEGRPAGVPAPGLLSSIGATVNPSWCYVRVDPARSRWELAHRLKGISTRTSRLSRTVESITGRLA